MEELLSRRIRVLGDELRYIFDRKHHDRYIGNNLERPRLLLKRNYIRDKTFDGGAAQGGR